MLIIIMYILLITATFMAFFAYNAERTRYDERVNTYDFTDKWAIRFYRWSFYVPFVWFLDDEEKDNKAVQLRRQLQQANLQHYYSYRSFTTMRLAVLAASTLVAFLFFILMKNPIALSLILSVPVENIAFETDTLLLISGSFVLLTLVPNLYLKFRISQYRQIYLDDIPIIQMFIILMMKSNKPLRDILYALTKVDTKYKEVFKITYRKYIRNQEEGMDYLESMFKDTVFRESVLVLRDVSDYAVEDSVRLLENNMKQIVERSNAEKRKKDLTGLVFTQAMIVVPFLAVILLGIVPIVYFGFSIFNSTGNIMAGAGGF